MAVEVELEVKNVELETKLQGWHGEWDFFIPKNHIDPGSIGAGIKGVLHLSRLASPGWKTGTKAGWEPGLIKGSVVVQP